MVYIFLGWVLLGALGNLIYFNGYKTNAQSYNTPIENFFFLNGVVCGPITLLYTLKKLF